MGGGQQNKAHKRGRKAGLSARDKHKNQKDAGGRVSVKSGSNLQQRRADRLNTAKQAREAKRAAVLASRRAPAGPRVVAVLPLSESVNVPEAWKALLAACGVTDCMMDDEVIPMTPQVVSPPDVKRTRFMLLPPVLGDERYDPFLAVDVGRTALAVVLLLGPDGEADAAGETMLRVLRALGSPPLIALVRSGTDNVHDMKARSAAKKRAAATLARHISAEPKVLAADGPADWTQAVSQLADMAPTQLPLWRQHRPQLLVEDARLEIGDENTTTTLTTLVLRGHVYNHGISVRQAVHIPGAGDFALSRIDEVVENTGGRAAPNVVIEDAMDTTEIAPHVVATAGPSERASLERENVPDPLAGEQTWPTEEELLEAEADRRETSKLKKRRLPKGTSEYQAAWISDDDEEEDLEDEEEDEEDEEMDVPGAVPMDDFSDDLHSLLNGAGGTEIDMGSEDEVDEEEERLRVAERRRREREDENYPDEVDTPEDKLARERFGKYRGLKSFRTSPWDPMESLPRDYARVFAFDNFVRTQKKAMAAVTENDQLDATPGQRVDLYVCNVPLTVASRVVDRIQAWKRGLASPLAVFGLLEHETKLSVAHFALTPSHGAPVLANKEEILLVTGLRAFHARPIFSGDDHGVDKHKMERFMHPGRSVVATVYAPISYPPLPALAFRRQPEDGGWELVASGTARRPDPDRIVLKKIVLTGYPVRTHKSKAVVKYMFHDPDDIRWFKPIDLWTRGGRRGRIREPLGTHGAMKTVFDGPLNQADTVCMSLYKRAFPKWPQDLTFAAL